ncbi:hypothetical protein GCM10018966_069130 [Streptomyces yanii]
MRDPGNWHIAVRPLVVAGTGDACGACREAAGVIDDRWPRAMRGEDARVSVARGYESFQFGVDSRVSLRLIRSIIARRIMASERCEWVS